MKSRELRQQLLNRWTGTTAVFPRRHPSAVLPNGRFQPKWAALFKGVDGSRTDITPPSRRCKVLFAPNGSVTTETWLQYLRYILPQVDRPENAVVAVTDWYAPHICEEAKQLAMDIGRQKVNIEFRNDETLESYAGN